MPFVRVKKCLNCGVAHEWLFEGMTLKELRLVKALTGWRAEEFGTELDRLDPDAIAALILIMHNRAKITVPFEDVDLDFKDFELEATEEEIAEMEALEARMAAEAEAAAAPKVKSATSASRQSSRRASGPKTKAA